LPRQALPRLSTEHSAELRAAIRAALDENGKTLEDLGAAIDAGRDAQRKSIHERTLRAWLRSDEPLARKTAAELMKACGSKKHGGLGIFTARLSSAFDKIKIPPMVVLVPRERRAEIEALLVAPGTRKLRLIQNSDGTQKRWIPGLGLTTLAKGAEVFVVPNRAPRSPGKPRRRK
jgi:hypothetical protein